MLNLTLTKTMDLHFSKYSNLEEYRQPPQESWVAHHYYFPEVDTRVLVYNNNTVSITGDAEEDFYEELILNCGEEGYVGCDEVGVGDFFGPTVYVSVKLTKESIKKLSRSFIDIRDSKRLKSKKILQICKTIGDICDYKYTLVYDHQMLEPLNAIEQKVVYHNKNIFDLEDTTVIDLFTTEAAFEKYSKKFNLEWPSDLVLENKADSNYLCVALASILARGIYLLEMLNISKKYPLVDIELGGNVKETAQKFKDTYGIDALEEVCKSSFKTFDELK